MSSATKRPNPSFERTCPGVPAHAAQLELRQHRAMDAKVVEHVESQPPKLERLLAMPPVKPGQLPRQMPTAGVYLLSEGGRDLYVGRSNDIRGRIVLLQESGRVSGSFGLVV